MTMFCSECGKEVPAQAKFCRACGAPQIARDPNRPPPLPPRAMRSAPAASRTAAPHRTAGTPVYRNFGRRVLAWLIDFAVWIGLAMAVAAVLGPVAGNNPHAAAHR